MQHNLDSAMEGEGGATSEEIMRLQGVWNWRSSEELMTGRKLMPRLLEVFNSPLNCAMLQYGFA